MLKNKEVVTREENGRFTIYLPIIVPESGCKIACLCFVLLIDILVAVLYFTTYDEFFLIILIVICTFRYIFTL